MAKKENQKYKSLKVAKILIENSDDEHPLTPEDIISFFDDDEDDLPAYRSVLRDIHQLDELFQEDDSFGYEIDRSDDYYNRGWKIIQRPFEYEDVQLLIEAINSSKGLSHKRSQELIEKVASLRSVYEKEKLLKTDVYTLGRTKTDKDIFFLLDSINHAIENNKKLSFVYKNYIFNKGKIEKVNRNQGEKIVVSPYKILMNDGNYYLLAYKSETNNMIPYRIDRMENTTEVNEIREGFDQFSKIDFSTYTKEIFNMWSGPRRLVQIRFTNDLLYTMIDRFGKQHIKQLDERHFVLSETVMISNQFFSWLAGFRKKAKILEPKEVVEQYKNFVKDIYEVNK